jgi:hypothetical protein
MRGGYRPAMASSRTRRTVESRPRSTPPTSDAVVSGGTRLEGGPEETALDPDQELDNLTLSQWLTVFSGIAFIAFGIAGLAITGFDGFADNDRGQNLAGIEVNPLHNIVHLVLGLPGLVLWRRVRWSIAYGVLLAVAYGGALAYGLVAIDQEWDVLSLDAGGNWLHLTLAGLGIGIAALGIVERRQSLPDTQRGEREGIWP